MCLDRARRGTQFTSDLLVHLASHDSLEYLSLAGSERGYQSSQYILPLVLAARCLRAKHRAFDSVDQFVFRHGLREDIFGTGLDRLDGGGNVCMARQED